MVVFSVYGLTLAAAITLDDKNVQTQTRETALLIKGRKITFERGSFNCLIIVLTENKQTNKQNE